MAVVRKIEDTKTSSMDKPEKDCVIAESGELPVEVPFEVEKAASQE